ncbi:hypothetical protein [Alkalicoccus halolimnae]|uniref:Uncharacterized protein n=1 Tax=Alkalicoccus halolimnae TaxID=1667239 RepID=A0A5C7FDS3_9BACI|nr:hypothetical protein [Alkalicoccus halolimnae]TXF83327.1 hypothetical protein FTX54_13190 [Alkalicoccus halolimnae]
MIKDPQTYHDANTNWRQMIHGGGGLSRGLYRRRFQMALGRSRHYALFGPGELAEARAVNESIPAQELLDFLKMMASFIYNWSHIKNNWEELVL